ncbi:MAG: hypothetical protein JWO02_3193 [Solirubrobacterales bacterium]|nr:hypothetical protein [Solirubrobacterales bacterium]
MALLEDRAGEGGSGVAHERFTDQADAPRTAVATGLAVGLAAQLRSAHASWAARATRSLRTTRPRPSTTVSSPPDSDGVSTRPAPRWTL